MYVNIYICRSETLGKDRRTYGRTAQQHWELIITTITNEIVIITMENYNGECKRPQEKASEREAAEVQKEVRQRRV